MPRASSLAAYLLEKCGVEVDLRPGAKGSFEIRAGGQLLHSKLSTGRFPEPEEIAARLG